MNNKVLVDKMLPILIVVVVAVILTLISFVFLFDYVETKKVEILEEDATEQGGGYIFSEEAKARFIKPGGETYIFSEEAKARFIKPGGETYIFSEEARARFIK